MLFQLLHIDTFCFRASLRYLFFCHVVISSSAQTSSFIVLRAVCDSKSDGDDINHGILKARSWWLDWAGWSKTLSSGTLLRSGLHEGEVGAKTSLVQISCMYVNVCKCTPGLLFGSLNLSWGILYGKKDKFVSQSISSRHHLNTYSPQHHAGHLFQFQFAVHASAW